MNSEKQNKLTLAERVDDLYVNKENGILYRPEEITNNKPPDDAILVKGLVRTFCYHPERLTAAKPKIEALIREIVADSFLKNKGGGYSFTALCNDRTNNQWGEHRSMEAFLCAAMGLKLAGYCTEDRSIWSLFPGGLPYVWFQMG